MKTVYQFLLPLALAATVAGLVVARGCDEPKSKIAPSEPRSAGEQPRQTATHPPAVTVTATASASATATAPAATGAGSAANTAITTTANPPVVPPAISPISVPAPTASSATRFGPKPTTKSKVRVEGTSNIHDWQVESPLVGGFFEAGPNFPLQAADAKPGKVDARADVFIPVGSLKSLKKDGSFYSTKMDEIMHGKLLKATSPKILYRLSELTLKEAPKAGEPMAFDSAGELVVAGVTNKITMPVTIAVGADKKLKITGAVNTKMTDYKVEPPALTVLGMGIKTADDIKVIFDWEVVGQ